MTCSVAGSSHSGSGSEDGEEEEFEEEAKRLAAVAAVAKVDDDDDISRGGHSRRELHHSLCEARAIGATRPHSNWLRCGIKHRRARERPLAPRKRARACIGFFPFPFFEFSLISRSLSLF